MKVARLYDSTDIRFEDEPVPTVGPGEALIRTRACGICSGDVMGWYMKKKAPLVFGHEPAGPSRRPQNAGTRLRIERRARRTALTRRKSRLKAIEPAPGSYARLRADAR